jgi:hypothetical protein
MARPDEVRKLMRMVGKSQHNPMQKMAVRLLRKYADV